MNALQTVAMAAADYVQYLDVDSVADQRNDQALRAERARAEVRLIAAVADLQAETGA